MPPSDEDDPALVLSTVSAAMLARVGRSVPKKSSWVAMERRKSEQRSLPSLPTAA